MFGKILTSILLVGSGYLYAAAKFNKKNEEKKDRQVENFIECQRCKTFVDIKEASLRDGKYYCKDCKEKISN